MKEWWEHIETWSMGLARRLQASLFPRCNCRADGFLRVCVSITAFPVTGGTRTVLGQIAAVTPDLWRIEYFARSVGPGAEDLALTSFGGRWTSPWCFPLVWLYVVCGFFQLLWQLHRVGYDLLLPQDGLYTAAFTGFAGKLAGVRVVCVDHGNLVALRSVRYWEERWDLLAKQAAWRRRGGWLTLKGYRISLECLAWFSAHVVDAYYVPGVAGDGVEAICASLKVGTERLTRFVNAVDLRSYPVLSAATRCERREQRGLSSDVILLAMVCRLAPEKGLEIAVQSFATALTLLAPELQARVRIVIAGDGPLYEPLMAEIARLGLTAHCLLWGEIVHSEVLELYSMSDICIYAGTRAGGYPLVVLEAMASGCAIVASDVPFANECMLAEGRGLIVRAGDREQTVQALVSLIEDEPLRQSMGTLARAYVAWHNTPAAFRKVWEYVDVA